MPDEAWPFSNRRELGRIGRQLLYAYRHDIDPDLLVGFLLQTGSVKEVAAKASAQPLIFEDWFRLREEAKTVGKPQAPLPLLATLHFTAVPDEEGGFPIEVGMAKVKGVRDRVVSESFLIKPMPNWQIRERWTRDCETATGIRVTDLYNGYDFLETCERVSEFFDCYHIVYCQDVEDIAYWFDLLWKDVYEEPPHFQIRDIGDYLQHDSSLRLQLRQRRTRIRTGLGSAGATAAELCTIARELVT